MSISVLIAGVDEVGRGPLAGPVVAAAVILDEARPIAGLADSKKLSAKKREMLVPVIQQNALAWAIGRAEVEEIDEINILQATFLAMRRAIAQLSVVPQQILVDGNRCPPNLPCACQAIIKGDQSVAAISAASILAKVARDSEMQTLHQQFPQYGWADNAGYPTAAHLQALKIHGVTPLHRRSFAPVKQALAQQVLL